jgi:uncharacterized protein YjbI with pentapeptide repeats
VERTEPDHEQAEETKQSRWGFRGKTLYKVLSDLVIPFLIPLTVAGFAFAQYKGQQNIEQHRAEQATLQAYLEQMGTLLLQEDLRTSEDIDVRNLARARTLTTLVIVEPHRKRAVVKFLYEASLINKDSPVVPLSGASLRDAELRDAELSNAELSHANLSGADLDHANLSHVDLSDANLSGADLWRANLSGADLFSAEGVTKEQLEQQAKSLEGAIMPDGSMHN